MPPNFSSIKCSLHTPRIDIAVGSTLVVFAQLGKSFKISTIIIIFNILIPPHLACYHHVTNS